MAGHAIDAAHVRALARSVRGACAALRAMPASERAAGIARAARLLVDADGALGAGLRSELAASTGLTPPLIEHGLRTTLASFEGDALVALLEQHAPGTSSECGPLAATLRDTRGQAPEYVAGVVLAGNVFSAAARPLLLPLLCGTGVIAKASHRDDALPRALQRALSAADARLGRACAVLTFAHDAQALQDALLHEADVVSAYGSDATIDAIAARLSPGTRLLAHGHGLGAIVVARQGLSNEDAARELAKRAALDVAAYDQRGCLSPHFALVEAGAAVDGRAFAHLIAQALDSLERALARGALPADAAAAQLQWRGVAAAVGELHHAGRWAVSYEADRPLRPSPGYRNLAVYDCPDIASARTRLSSLGPHLKALGVAGTDAHQQLGGLAPYMCELGAMQTPPLEARLDGLHPLGGLCSLP